MARTKSVICAGCGERANREWSPGDDSYDGRYIDAYTDEGKPVCSWCVESDRNHPNVVTVFDPEFDEAQGIFIGDYVAENVTGYDLEPEEILAMFGRPTWHSTDAWRGYAEFAVPKGHTSVADGWYTGWATENDMPHKMSLYDLADALKSAQGGGTLPCRVYVLTTTTSNVFSQTMDIVVADSDLDAFTGWLAEEVGLSPEDLRYALS